MRFHGIPPTLLALRGHCSDATPLYSDLTLWVSRDGGWPMMLDRADVMALLNLLARQRELLEEERRFPYNNAMQQEEESEDPNDEGTASHQALLFPECNFIPLNFFTSISIESSGGLSIPIFQTCIESGVE